MSTQPPKNRPRPDIVAEACAWFVEFRSGETATETRDRFDAWLRQSPAHIQAYLEVAAAWADLPTQDPEGRLDVETLIERARSTRADDNLVSIAPQRATGASLATATTHRTRIMPRALAACVVFIAVLAAAIGWLYHGVSYATGLAEQRTIRLSDSSVIDLNARSRIRVHFTRGERSVELIEGQALFHVAKDPQRPFVVHSDGAAVRAVGTQFDVYRKRSGVVVTVLEGRVSVTPAEADTRSASPLKLAFLSAGEQLTVTPVAASKPRLADVSAATAWVQRRFVFEDTPLSDVADEFNRYSPRQLIIEDPELAQRTISGIYSSADPASLIGFLRAQPELQVAETAHEIRVTRRQ